MTDGRIESQAIFWVLSFRDGQRAMRFESDSRFSVNQRRYSWAFRTAPALRRTPRRELTPHSRLVLPFPVKRQRCKPQGLPARSAGTFHKAGRGAAAPASTRQTILLYCDSQNIVTDRSLAAVAQKGLRSRISVTVLCEIMRRSLVPPVPLSVAVVVPLAVSVVLPLSIAVTLSEQPRQHGRALDFDGVQRSGVQTERP
jgi:hypothetical protein